MLVIRRKLTEDGGSKMLPRRQLAYYVTIIYNFIVYILSNQPKITLNLTQGETMLSYLTCSIEPPHMVNLTASANSFSPSHSNFAASLFNGRCV